MKFKFGPISESSRVHRAREAATVNRQTSKCRDIERRRCDILPGARGCRKGLHSILHGQTRSGQAGKVELFRSRSLFALCLHSRFPLLHFYSPSSPSLRIYVSYFTWLCRSNVVSTIMSSVRPVPVSISVPASIVSISSTLRTGYP